MAIPKAPFPSFTLALTSQNEQGKEDPNPPPSERHTQVVDLMRTYDSRMPYSWNMPADASDEEKSDTETVFEVKEPDQDEKDNSVSHTTRRRKNRPTWLKGQVTGMISDKVAR